MNESLVVPPKDCVVWVREHGRVHAEKWPHDAPGGVKADRFVVAYHELRPGEFGMAIAILEQRYPYVAPEGGM